MIAADGMDMQDLAELIETDPGYILSFTLIIASNVEPLVEARLANLLWQGSGLTTHTTALTIIESQASTSNPDIPLIAVRTSGFVGRVRIQLNEHCSQFSVFNLRRADSAVIDTHPDTTHTLRIDAAFPALEEYASSLELNGLDSMEYSHVPYVVLLVKALGVWRSSVSCGTVLDDDG